MLESFESLEKFKEFLMNHFRSKCDDCESREECKKEENYNLVGDLTPNEMEEFNVIKVNIERLKSEAKVLHSRREYFWDKLCYRLNIPNKGILKIDNDKLYIRDDSREE